MQQECLARIIMTSKRERSIDAGAIRTTLITLASVLLAACAALPDDAPVVEQLDPETGVTIARLGKPVELYVEPTRPGSTGRFGFLGPFETNQMGKREMFLMIALPLDEKSEAGTPALSIDGNAVALGDVGRDADFAGLRKSPYKLSTPWIAMFYFRTDDDTITRLANAGTITVRVTETTRDGTTESEFLVQPTEDARLREFAAR
jgi:hypothetical protein